ncbi:hypothetical protein RLQ00_001653 [Salmonella enterica]|uniref:hypothetical protein n=1 Tax=Citrobacter freundii TaxID=546 RepID=UPI00141462BE|nr:hypothetical protein [Citrobacter freundii]EAZ5991688.1 hypothetical protein [Salmonella enterica]EBY2261608.1 hypothetical protein [Salmonella enterica subsp. enterica serovar Newport]EBJ0730115.1 hypothetical protein [Salmonella enterica]ECO6783094.1 hypothetical protein [Salmonella enterica]ECO7517320.1 hypothetical protein [Salmonella enterica]
MHKYLNFKSVVFVFGVVFIFTGFVKLCLEHIPAASLAIAAGIILLLFTDMDKIESFALLGLKAKLKTTLVEAEDIVLKLRKTSILQTEMLFTIMARLGGGRPLTRREQYDYVQSISKQLRNLKVDEDEIEAAKKHYYYIVSIHMAFDIATKIERLLQNKAGELNKLWQDRPVLIGPPNNYKTFHEIEGEFREDEFYFSRKGSELRSLFYGLPEFNPHEKIMDFIKELDRMTEEERSEIFQAVEEDLNDLDFIIRKHEFRRPDNWFTH